MRTGFVLACLLLVSPLALARPAPPAAGAQLTVTNRTVDLDGKIGLASVAKTVDRLLELDAMSSDPIFLKVNAYGESLEAALAMADAIRALASPVYAIVQSRAYEAAAVVALACRRVYVYPNAVILIRLFDKVSVDATSAQPPDDPFKNRYLDQVHGTLAARLGVSLDEFKKRTEKGWWLDARAAVDARAADGVVERMNFRELFVETTEVKRTITATRKAPPVAPPASATEP